MLNGLFGKLKSAKTLPAALGSLSRRFQRPDAQPGWPGPIGVLAIMKNEAMNIREWLDHYRWQGVDRVFLIDNGSTDGTRGLLDDAISSGFVEYFWRPEKHRQVSHYAEIFGTARIQHKVNWLVIADLDEFWYSPGSDLRRAIEAVAIDADLIYTNWTVFGSGGFDQHPRSLRKELVYRYEALGRHCNSKWICRTSRIVSGSALGIHKVRWVDSRLVVSDNVHFKLNHYVTQSLHYFTEVKMKRGDASSQGSDAIRDLAYFNDYNREATVLDRGLADEVIAAGMADAGKGIATTAVPETTGATLAVPGAS